MHTATPRRFWSVLRRAVILALCAGLGSTGSLRAADGIQDRIANLLASMQAAGEYVICAYHLGDGEDGNLQIIVETTEGKKLFNESGQLVEKVDRQGNRTLYADGIPVKTITPSGQVLSQTQVKSAGKAGSAWMVSRDYLGNLERRRVNAAGDMEERIDQTGGSYRYETHKDARGRTLGVTEINQRDGTRVTRFFDPKTGDVDRMLDDKGALILLRYEKDKQGRKLRSIEFNTQTGKTTEKQFDELGREVVVAESGGAKKEIEYTTDGQDHVTSATETVSENGEQYQVRKEYDEAKRVTREEDSRGRTTTYRYTLAEDGSTKRVQEEETLVDEQGRRIFHHRVRILGEDGRVKTLLEDGFKTEYEYEVDGQGRTSAVRETKSIEESGQRLYTQRTEMDELGMPLRSEKWEELGPTGKRHTTTAFVTDRLSGKTRTTVTVNDLGDVTRTDMDEAGRPVRSETQEAYGARLKRHSVTRIVTDRRSNQTSSTDSTNDLGDRTLTTMDENGLAVRSEAWTTRGARLKRHSLTEITTNRFTGKPERTVTVNDRGDITITYMDENALPFLSETHDRFGAELGRNQTSTIESDPATGMTRSVRTTSGLAAAVTLMDVNGLPVSSESRDIYGAALKRHQNTEITTDPDTGLTRRTESVNDRGDRVLTLRDENGLAAESESWNALGARLKRHALTEITTDPDTEVTQVTEGTNDLGDFTRTEMDENGLPTASFSQSTLGPVKKRDSSARILTNPETGQTAASEAVDTLGDRTLTLMDENGLAKTSEGWLALGATQKRHSRTEIATNPDTGETAGTAAVNDRGDKTETAMDENGLAIRSEGWLALGATEKRHSVTKIQTDPDTGVTRQTAAQNDRGDATLTVMDGNGLAVSSKSRMALGALQKRGSTTLIQTDAYTGETAMTCNLNERGDMAWTAMDENGLAVKSRSLAALGATLKRNSLTAIETDAETGETAATSSMNDR
ncbi:MAG: hypothetical protein AB1439_12790, partial [candidate division FCPU426 bacterium]